MLTVPYTVLLTFTFNILLREFGAADFSGTGAALARRFAEGNYRVAMLARNADRLSALEREIPNSIAVPCDVRPAFSEPSC